jgi:hypothetical protein
MAHDDPTGPTELMELEAPTQAFEAYEPAPQAAEPLADDPTGMVEGADVAEAGALPASPIAPTPIPHIPLPVALRNVSGRYRGQVGAFQLEARVDVDGARALNKLSGDFFTVSGGTTTYFGSFIVNSPVITRTATQIVARGLGSYTFAAGAPVVQVTIPRRKLFQPAAPATCSSSPRRERPDPATSAPTRPPVSAGC